MERTPSFVVQAFGNYILLDRIAVGGMAEIFKAKQSGVRGFEKIVVIKKILQHLGEDPEFVSMFEDEAKIAAQLNQANIVQIYELGEVNDVLYIVMEFVEGKNLRDLNRALQAKGLHLSVEQALFIITEILKGLDYAHRKKDSMGNPLQIIHRDMSPQNIVISYEGEVKILDFGIAKAASKATKTEAGVLKGKFSYMSPEQASGRPIDQTTDIYASAVILHEMLTSERLFRAETDMETLERVKRGIVAPPSERNPLVPQELDRIVLKALHRDSEKRYQSASEFLSDLSKLMLQNQFSYSSRELSSFMKTIFGETIIQERARLKKALSEAPLQDLSSQKEVRTHIAFKAPQLSNKNEAQALSSDEVTQITANKKQPSNALFKFAIVTFFVFALISFLWTETFQDQHKEVSKIESPGDQLQMKEVSETPAKPKLPETKLEKPTIEKKPEVSIDTFLEGIEPPPIRKDTAQAPAQTQNAFGSIDVVAPLEGYAQLYIDGQSYGSVPGPRARGIRLKTGEHEIQCQTATKIYRGTIVLKENEHLRVRCQEFKQETL